MLIVKYRKISKHWRIRQTLQCDMATVYQCLSRTEELLALFSVWQMIPLVIGFSLSFKNISSIL